MPPSFPRNTSFVTPITALTLPPKTNACKRKSGLELDLMHDARPHARCSASSCACLRGANVRYGLTCILVSIFFIRPLGASQTTLILSRVEAERDAVQYSNQLKAVVENKNAAEEQKDAQYANLFPRLTFDAYYQYLSAIPQIGFIDFQFGAHDNYSYGPTLSYTLWDTFSARKAYHGLGKLTESREGDRQEEVLRILFETRSDYVHVQELIEELRAVSDSLELSRFQYQDILSRLKAGGATRLDRVESERGVLSYEIQFEQKQAELSAALKDLLSRLSPRPVGDLSHPGPAGLPKVSLVLDLDSIPKSLETVSASLSQAPDDSHPRISSRELLAQASELQAESIQATLWPTFKFQGKFTLQYPLGPQLEQVNQNSILITASVPLFEASQTRHLAAQKHREAEGARYQKDQTRIDLNRDYSKAQELLESLRVQQTLAAQDVKNSEEAAALYYQSYKGGKTQLIDVQTANNRLLLSKVNKTRIDAQILNQLDRLRALSGREAQIK